MIEVKRSCTSSGATARRILPMIEGAKLLFKNGEVKWWIGNWTNDMEKHEQILVLKDVFRHYEFENYPLRYPSTKDEIDAQIKIFFVAPDGIVYCENEKQFVCPEKLDDKVLAVAYAPYGGEWQGYVFINDNLFWALRKDAVGKHLLYDTLVHELGHTHNMDHSTNKNDLMYYMEGENQVWGFDSRNLLFKIYKDDRLNELKKTESGIMLVSYSNEFATTPTTPKKTVKARNGNGCAIIPYIIVVIAAIIISYLAS